MVHRLARSLVWSIGLSLVPYFGLVLILSMKSGTPPSANAVVGSGQLLLTSVALLGGGIKEMSYVDDMRLRRTRDLVTGLAVLFVIGITLTYGFVAGELLNNGRLTSDEQGRVTPYSIGVLVASAIIALAAVAVATPRNVGLQGGD